MLGESGVTRSAIAEFHSWDIPGEQIEGESGFTQSIIDDVTFWDIEREQNGRRKGCYWKGH